jgi:hypothetical protein
MRRVVYMLLTVVVLCGCSTAYNTRGSRMYHAMTTRYNVYYNGATAYDEGLRAYRKRDTATATAMMDRAIEKCQKAVSLHSIRRKPVRKPGHQYSAEYKRWLASREFNPFMHNVWMLMGKAQFGKADFTAAAATFIYTARLYQNRPEIAAEANIRLAACYIGSRQLYEAEEVLSRLNRLTLTKRLTRMRTAANDSLTAARAREERRMAAMADTTTATPSQRVRLSSPLQMEDSLYTVAYDAYRAKNYPLADSCAAISARDYATGRHRSKFLYLQAMSDLQTGRKEMFIERMRELVRNYPDGEISEIASAILKGVDEGRPLLGAAPQGGNIWSRSSRNATSDTTELTEADTIPHFTARRDGRHLFVIAYPAGTISRNALLYQVARFNFSTFLVKEFDMEFSTADGIERLEIGWFANMDEANYYNYKLNSYNELSDMLKKTHTLIISEKNYEILNKYYSFDNYTEFYSTTLDDMNDNVSGKSMDDPINNLPDEEEDEEEDDSDAVDPRDSNNKTIYIY